MSQHRGMDTDTLEALRELTILFVDDDLFAREQMAALMRRMGMAVVLAEDGEKGLAAFRRTGPDLVITDILMPGMDGLALAQAIRDLDPDAPIFVATGVDEPELIIKAVERNVDHLLLKPILPDALLSAILKTLRVLQLRRRVQEAERAVRNAFDAYPNFVLVVEGGRVVYANAGLCSFLGFASYDDLTAQNRSVGEFIVEMDGAAYDGGPEGWVRAIVDDTLDREHRLKLANPRAVAGRAQTFTVAFSQFSGPNRHLLTLSDVTELEDARQSLEDQAATDPLTGVCNRRRFAELLAGEQRRALAGKGFFALIMFDIDHFKSINDTFGHDAGDSVLKALVGLVQDSVRASDSLARLGGEEFMVLAAGSGLNRAGRVAERLRREVAGHEFAGLPRPVTCSFGVTQYRDGEPLDDLLKRVDEVLYRAKQGGRNRVEMA